MTCDGKPFYLRVCLHLAPFLGMAFQGERRNRFKKVWVFRNDAERAQQGHPSRPPCSSTREIYRPRWISVQLGNTIQNRVWVLLTGKYFANFIPGDDEYRLALTVKFLLFSMQASINSHGLYFPTDDTFLMAHHVTSYLFSFPCTTRRSLERFASRHGTACLALPLSVLRTQLRRAGHDSALPVICIVR